MVTLLGLIDFVNVHRFNIFLLCPSQSKYQDQLIFAQPSKDRLSDKKMIKIIVEYYQVDSIGIYWGLLVTV